MKFGGTSVAGAEDIKRAARRIVAAREGGKQVVAVLSARGKTTDELVDAAYEISERPLEREMDMLLSTGERISCALCAMAIHDMGHYGDLADRLAGRDRHRLLAHQGADHRRPRRSHPRRARRRPDRPRRRLPGRLGRLQGRDHARARRLRHHRGRDRRRAGRRRLRDLHRRRRRVQRRSAARPGRPQALAGLVRRDARDVILGRRGAAAARGRVRPQPRRQHPLPQLVQGRPPVPSSLAEDATMEQPMVTAVTHAYEARVTLTGLRDEPGVAGRVFGALADSNVNVDMIIQNEPVSTDQKARPLVHGLARRPARRDRGARAARGRRAAPTDDRRRQGLDRRRRDAQPPGRRREGLQHPRRRTRSTSR